MCGEDRAVAKFSRLANNYAYEIAPDRPFPNNVNIWNTFAFRNIGYITNIDSLEDSFYRIFVNNHMMCYQELRYEYEGWAGRLPTIESQVIPLGIWLKKFIRGSWSRKLHIEVREKIFESNSSYSNRCSCGILLENILIGGCNAAVAYLRASLRSSAQGESKHDEANGRERERPERLFGIFL